MAGRTKPAIRFAGFSDDWEQRKLGEIGNAYSGVGFPDNEQGGTEGIPFFKVSDMNSIGNENELQKANNYVDIFQISRHKWKPITEVPAIFFAKVGAAVMLNRKRLVQYPFLLDNNTMAYSFEKGIWNISFGKSLFETIDLTSLVQVGALPSYNASDVEDIKIFLPSLQEQARIGTFFRLLDCLITLHQRKCDHLKNIKKSMLEKMFPKNGADVPEIRFAGFSDDWEQRKLGELSDISSASRVHKNEWTESGVPFFRSSDVVSAFKGEENEKAFISYSLYEELAKKSGKVQAGDVLITGGGSIGIPYLVRNNAPLYFKDADLLWLKRSRNLVGNFLYTFFTAPVFSTYVQSISHIGTIAHYTIEQVKDTPILLPKVDEQTKIGAFFTSFDHFITLHQRKVELLQHVKKSCLEKMFV